jgi:hypothetical protein
MKEGGKPDALEEDPKKLESPVVQERATAAGVNDPLAKEREKV